MVIFPISIFSQNMSERGGHQISFFPKFKIVHIILGGGGGARKLLIFSTFVTFLFGMLRKVRIAYLMSTLRTFLVALQMLPPTHPPSHRAGILRRFVGLISIKNNYAGLSEAEKLIPQSLRTVSNKLDPRRGGGLISYFTFVQLDLS